MAKKRSIIANLGVRVSCVKEGQLIVGIHDGVYLGIAEGFREQVRVSTTSRSGGP
jgi:uncharacterized protein with FMN-binding domain